MNLKIPFLMLLLISLQFPLFANKSSQEYIEEAKRDLPPQCLFFFKMYLNAKSPKAFAYAYDNQSKYTCRFSSGSDSGLKAQEVALASCRKSKKKRNIKSSCRLYKLYVKGFLSKRSQIFLNKYKISLNKIEKELKTSKTEYKKTQKEETSHKKVDKVTLAEIEKMKLPQTTTKKKVNHKKREPKQISNLKESLPKPCRIIYKLYQLSKPNKAFYVAIDNHKRFSCKFSAKASSLKRAKEVGLKSCQKTKKRRGVKADCSLFEFAEAPAKVKIPQPTTKEKKKVSKTKVVSKPKVMPITKPPKPIHKPTVQTKTDAPRNIVKKTPRVRNKALEKAILDTDLPTIKKLIAAGADVDTEADDHSRALFVATAKGDIKFVKELLAKGANPFFTKGDGNNLLVAAIMSGKLEMLKLILEQGVDPNQQCNEGNTPLHFAFMMFDDKMMRELYKNGAIDDIPNDKGETVKEMAKAYHVNLNRLKPHK